MELQVGVKIFLKGGNNKFLFLKRSKKSSGRALGDWDIVGGRIEPGIGLFENLKREVFEETGLTLQLEPKLLSAQDIFPENRHVIRLCFVSQEIFSDNPKLSSEHSEFSWFDKEEAVSLSGLDSLVKEVLFKNF